MALGNKKGQLFLIEIIVALSVLFILITALFTTQEVTTPADTNDLDQISIDILTALSDSDLFYVYLAQANYSYYGLGNDQAPYFDTLNSTKIDIANTIDANIPVIASYKAITSRFDKILGEWIRIDVVNFEAYTSSGSDIIVNELYLPGFNGVFDQFKFQLQLWFEVQI